MALKEYILLISFSLQVNMYSLLKYREEKVYFSLTFSIHVVFSICMNKFGYRIFKQRMHTDPQTHTVDRLHRTCLYTDVQTYTNGFLLPYVCMLLYMCMYVFSFKIE